MTRTTKPAVAEVIETDEAINLTPFIRTATRLTDWLEAQDVDNQLGDGLLEEIETYLAAHFYEHNKDRKFQSSATGRASGVYQGKREMGLMGTPPGQTACDLDITGRLAALSKGRTRASISWAGTAEDSVRPWPLGGSEDLL